MPMPMPMPMPSLNGSPKQTAWAETICTKKIPEILILAGNDCERSYAEALILKATSASWWIDQRNLSATALAQSLVEDFGNQVIRPTDGTLQPDKQAPTIPATDVNAVVAKTREAIERQPGYRYSSPALISRIAAGLAPGDIWHRAADLKAVYLGNRKIMVQRIGIFGIALQTNIIDATDGQLDEMLMALGRRAAKAALRS